MSELLFFYVQHGATVVEDKLYIYGGNHNGRYLNDLHVSLFSISMLHEAVFWLSSNINISHELG